MISISLGAGVTAMWLVSLPVDQLSHQPPTDLTVAKAAESAQEAFEQARNTEIDASIAAVAARRAREAFEQARNTEIDASIAAITIPWALTFADMQSFAAIEGLGYPPQP